MSLPPSLHEFNKVFKCKKPGKTSGPDNIPFEFFTHGGPKLRNQLLILKIRESKTLLNDFHDATIITIYKIGDWEDYNNYQGISLLSISSKIFTHILLNHFLILTCSPWFPVGPSTLSRHSWHDPLCLPTTAEVSRTITACNVHLLRSKESLWQVPPPCSVGHPCSVWMSRGLKCSGLLPSWQHSG